MKKIHIGIVCDQFGNLNRGGAEEQMDNTVKALEKINGITIEFITYQTKEIKKFDIVHFFKSKPEYFTLVDLLILHQKPYVVSTVTFPEHYWLEVIKFRIFHHIPILNKIPLQKFLYHLWNNASVLFPNTDEEALFLKKIGIKTESKIIPNGLLVDDMDMIADKNKFLSQYPFLKEKKFILNIGRIDKRKNQKRLVQACMSLNIAIVLIGNISDKKLFQEIESLNYDQFYYLGPIFDKKILFGAYQACSIFALPSTMETPGISAMEAAFFNKPIVVTKYGGTQYYFKDKAYYVDWRSIKDIQQGIQTMIKIENINTKDLMKQYSWDNIAQQYIREYYKILDTNK